MSFYKRAWFYVTRKRSKTALMFLILFGIATATISGIAIKKATIDARDQINQSMNASFTLGINEMNNNGIFSRGVKDVPAEAIKKIAELDGIASYNAKMVGEVELVDLKKVAIEDPKVQYDESLEAFNQYSDLDGMTDTSLDNKFVSGLITLSQGRHIHQDDINKVLVHEKFAKLNGLELGDKLYVKASDFVSAQPKPDAVKDKIGLEIVGLFEGSNMESALMESELNENILMTDLNTSMMLRGVDKETATYMLAKFYVKDPKKLGVILKGIEKLAIDWEAYKITESSSEFPSLTGSLDSMDELIQTMLIGILAASAVILSLILAFWINGRIHETGVLLSLGISKFNIIAQYIAELFLIAIIAFGSSYFSGQIIAQNIGDHLVKQASDANTTEVQLGSGEVHIGMNLESNIVNNTLEEIDVSISMVEMGYVWLIGGLLILFAVSISSVFIIRLKPKTILSKMS